MGWEYHRRRRDGRGRFAATPGRRTVQLHLRLPEEQADFIRHKAARHQMGLGEYVWKVCVGFYQLRRLYDREREKRRVPADARRDEPR